MILNEDKVRRMIDLAGLSMGSSGGSGGGGGSIPAGAFVTPQYYSQNFGLLYKQVTTDGTTGTVTTAFELAAPNMIPTEGTETDPTTGNVVVTSLIGPQVMNALVIGNIMLTYDETNNAIKVVNRDGTTAANFYATGGVSALGYSPGGGGGGDTLTEPLASINSAGLGTPTAAGQVITWNGSEWIFDIPQGGGGGGTGTVTSITAGTGLSGGTITTMGTIAISSTYQGYISHGETAYGWGNHADAGYATQQWVNQQGFLTSSAISDMATQTWVGQQGFLTSSAISDMATKTWVNQQGFLTSSAISDMATQTWVGQQGFITASVLSSYLPLTGGTLTGALHMGSAAGASPYIYWGDGSYAYIGEDSDDHITLRGDKGVNILTGSNYELQWNGNTLATQDWVVAQGYVTSSGVTSVATGTGLTGGTITTSGTISINSTYQTYISHGESAYNQLYGAKWWGQSMDGNNVVSGDIAMNVGDRIYYDGNNTLEVDNYSVALGYGWRSTKPIGLYGTAINFYPNGSQVASVDSSGLRVNGGYYLDGKLFANNNNGLHIGYGFADAELPTTIWGDGLSFRSVDGNYGSCTNIGNTYGIMGTDFIGVTNKFRFEYDSTNNTVWVLKADGTPVNFASMGGVSALGVGSSGTPSIDSLRVTRIYFDATRYLEVSGSTLRYYNGSSYITIA